MTLFTKAPDSICILRLSAIGDVCHALAAVRRIQSHWPQTKITWILGKIEYQLLKDIEEIEFVIFDKSQGRKAIRAVKHQLADRVFDVLLHMQVAFRANVLSFWIPAKKKVGFDWKRSKELHYPFTSHHIPFKAHRHVLDGFMDFVDYIGVPESQSIRWDLPFQEFDSQWLEQQEFSKNKYVVINPAASKKERSWAYERYAELAEHLVEKGYSVVLTGGPAKLDRELADQILDYADVDVIDLVGKTTLGQLICVLKHSQLVVAPDTGPAHLGVAAATKVVGLYAHSNPRRTGPYLFLDNVVSVYDEVIQEQTGKSWQELPWGKRAKGSDLMDRISLERVISEVDKLLSEGE